MKQRIIGVYADSIDKGFAQKAPYLNFILNFGTPRLITPYDNPKAIARECDVLLMPGGPDVDPRRYNEIPHPATGRINVHYEYMDQYILPEFIALEKPVIGICRGFQSLNVFFGGTLFQDIKGHNQMNHYQTLRSDTESELIAGERIYKINSIHHQAVKDLGKDLTPIGLSSVAEKCPSLQYPRKLKKARAKGKFGKEILCFVEAFKHDTLPVIGFQYHPEEFNCEFAIEQINNMFESYDNKVNNIELTITG